MNIIYFIIKWLDFENLDIIKTMLNNLSKALNNEEYIEKYKIIVENNVKNYKFLLYIIINIY